MHKPEVEIIKDDPAAAPEAPAKPWPKGYKIVGQHQGLPVVAMTTGPFKGRTYMRAANGQLTRVHVK